MVNSVVIIQCDLVWCFTDSYCLFSYCLLMIVVVLFLVCAGLVADLLLMMVLRASLVWWMFWFVLVWDSLDLGLAWL